MLTVYLAVIIILYRILLQLLTISILCIQGGNSCVKFGFIGIILTSKKCRNLADLSTFKNVSNGGINAYKSGTKE